MPYTCLRAALALILAAVTTGCALKVFTPWPYTVNSDPDIPDNPPRTQVATQSIEPPLQDVCHLKTWRRNHKKIWLGLKTATSSAALVDGRYLVTAAHNVADYPLNNRLVRMEVRCNVREADSAAPLVTLHRGAIKRQRLVPGYALRWPHNTDKKFEFDYAFVDLGRVITASRAFSMDRPASLSSNDSVFIGGYPGRFLADGYTLWSGGGLVADVDSNLFTYHIETAFGNSGAPLWVKSEGRSPLVGVHIAGSTGRIVDERFIREFEAWRNASGTRAHSR